MLTRENYQQGRGEHIMLKRLLQAAIITFLLQLLTQISPPDRNQPASLASPEISRLVMKLAR